MPFFLVALCACTCGIYMYTYRGQLGRGRAALRPSAIQPGPDSPRTPFLRAGLRWRFRIGSLIDSSVLILVNLARFIDDLAPSPDSILAVFVSRFCMSRRFVSCRFDMIEAGCFLGFVFIFCHSGNFHANWALCDTPDKIWLWLYSCRFCTSAWHMALCCLCH